MTGAVPGCGAGGVLFVVELLSLQPAHIVEIANATAKDFKNGFFADFILLTPGECPRRGHCNPGAMTLTYSDGWFWTNSKIRKQFKECLRPIIFGKNAAAVKNRLCTVRNTGFATSPLATGSEPVSYFAVFRVGTPMFR